MPRRAVTFLVIVSTLLAVTAAPANAKRERRPRIVNGLTTSAFPSVGALLMGDDVSLAGGVCTGVMIGCETFLTAAHCITPDPRPERYFVFLPHAGFFAVNSTAYHFNYPAPDGQADLAVLDLVTPVTAIPPSHINTGGSPGFASAGTIVGFGRTAGAASDFGLKRYGAVSTATCAGLGGKNDTGSVCWNFDAPLGPPGTDSNTCRGDSGGPLYVGGVVAGITSGGSNSSCLTPDRAYDANVFTYRDWIEFRGGADLANSSCGGVAQIGSPGVSVHAFSGNLAFPFAEALHSFSVPYGTSELRVALNAKDDTSSDVDLYVRRGGQPFVTLYDCKSSNPTPYDYCSIAGPQPGTWYVLARRETGAGDYQLTASVFGVDCADPVNDGYACDDGDPCTAGETCQASSCIGSAAPNGTLCDDDNACTQPDTCTSGICGGTVQPQALCTGPFVTGKGSLSVRDSDATNSNRLTWSWTNGSLTDDGEFGDPVAGSTRYNLCLYDDTPATTELRLAVTLLPGAGCGGTESCWKAKSRGFSFKDKSGVFNGIRGVTLTAGADGKASIKVKGKDVALSSPLPFTQLPKLTLQITNELGCWEATFTAGADTENSATKFQSKGD